MTLRDQITEALQNEPAAVVDEPNDEAPEDEIAAAILRQLDVLEGTYVVLGNMVQMLGIQIANLRSEVTLLTTPEPGPAPAASQPEIKRTPSGAVVEASLPEEKRLPGFCNHEDALLVDTADGVVRVCADCNDNEQVSHG